MTTSPPRAWRQADSLSIEEAGRVLGVRRSRSYELADSGTLPTFRTPMGRRRVRPRDLEELLGSEQPELWGGEQT